MIGRGKLVLALLVVLGFSGWMSGQQGTPQSPASVPRLVNFSGRAIDETTKSVSGIAAITFSIYKDQYGGSSLWMETQNVRTDAKGNYTVQLGATTSEGLPLDLFASGEGRWLGTRVNGGEEQPRVLLLSVPYALKAADAQTLGGLPASAFALAGTAGTGSSGQLGATTVSGSSPAGPNVGGSGTQDYIPIWTDGSGDLGNSILYQTGSGSSAKVGINETKPLFTLDVNGQELVRGLFEMATTGYANKSKGFNSNPINLESSAFNSSTQKYALNHFQWQAEPSGNNTTTPGATLNLLYGTDPNQPAETGLNVASNGQITFAAGQAFPGAGTVTNVGSGAGLTGGPITGSGTLSIATGAVTNSMLSNPSLTVTANSPLSGGGSVSLGGNTSLGLKNCSNNQVLEYVGGAWTCTNLSAGTVTSVGLSAPSADFTVSGSPITTSGTLGLAWTVAPTSADTANAIVKRDANQSFSSGSILAFATNNPAVTATDNTTSGSDGVLAYSTNGFGVNATGDIGIEATGSYAGLIASGISYGISAEGNQYGVFGSGVQNGVFGEATGGPGVSGVGDTGVVGGGGTYGVYGTAETGVYGTGTTYGVYGTGPDGVYGIGTGSGVYGTGPTGVSAISNAQGNPGIYAQAGESGWAVDAYDTSNGTGVLAGSGSGYAGYFNGDVQVDGTLSADKKDFKIDHPLDPGNKYLVHTSVESSEMKNIYDGVVTTDAQGEATVRLPEWFEALNTDFRYQLTVIGQFAQAIIARKVENHQFKIRTNAPNVEVSWQVTGVRQDAYAKAHPLVVEEKKPEKERGFYLHPELYGAPEEQGVLWATAPAAMKQWKAARTNPPQIPAPPAAPIIVPPASRIPPPPHIAPPKTK